MGGEELLIASVTANRSVFDATLLAAIRACSHKTKALVDSVVPSLVAKCAIFPPGVVKAEAFDPKHCSLALVRLWEVANTVDALQKKIQALRREMNEIEYDKSDTLPNADSVEDLFSAGSRFEGKVCIPYSPEQGQPALDSEYFFEMFTPFVDIFGNNVRRCLHGVAEDSQVCCLGIQTNDKLEIAIDFADAETICQGTADLATRSIKGDVSQLEVAGQEGFTLPRDSETHVFFGKQMFAVGGRCEHANQLRVKYGQQKREFSQAVAQLASVLCCVRIPPTQLSQIDWIGAWEDLGLQVEEMCCWMRHYKSTLNSMTFATQADKTRILQTMTSAGLERVKIVNECNRLAHTLRTLVAVCPSLRRFQRPVTSFMRLQLCDDSLGHEIRRVQDALTQDSISRWRVEPTTACQQQQQQQQQSQDSQNTQQPGECTICMGVVEPTEVRVILPCSHIFHEDCAVKWLHNTSSCPCCRFDLKA